MQTKPNHFNYQVFFDLQFIIIIYLNLKCTYESNDVIYVDVDADAYAMRLCTPYVLYYITQFGRCSFFPLCIVEYYASHSTELSKLEINSLYPQSLHV